MKTSKCNKCVYYRMNFTRNPSEIAPEGCPNVTYFLDYLFREHRLKGECPKFKRR